MKVTCSASKVRAKFDVLGENHGQEILELQKKMSSEEEFLVKQTKKVAAVAEVCRSHGHLCSQKCLADAAKAKGELKQAKKNMHPGFTIAFDNIDGRHERRHMTKDNQNLDFHWVNHKVIMNRVCGHGLETLPRDICSISNIKFFPTVEDQKLQRHNYVVLVSRVLVEHLRCFSFLKDVCVSHISHKYSKEMAKKSEVVSYTFPFTFCIVMFCFAFIRVMSKVPLSICFYIKCCSMFLIFASSF